MADEGVRVLLCRFWSRRCGRCGGLGVVVVVLGSFGRFWSGRRSFGRDVGEPTHFGGLKRILRRGCRGSAL